MGVSFKDKKKNGGRGSFFDNAGLKLLALIFAVALWYLVVGEKSSEMGLMVQLGLKGMPAEMIITKTPRLDVEVRVAGPGGFLDKLSASDVTVARDIGDAKEGVNTYRITPGNVKVPNGIKVLTVRPSSIDVTLERLAKKTMVVKVKTRGVPAKGYKVRAVTVEPQSVEVLGRKHVMKTLKDISTETLDIGGVDGDLTQSLHLDLSRKGLSGAEPDSVKVNVDIDKVTPQGSGGVKMKNKGKAKQ